MKESHPLALGGFTLPSGLLALKIFDRSFTDVRRITLPQLP